MKKEKNKEIKSVSKSKIMIAWVFLIILIAAAAGVSYIKFFSPDIAVEDNQTTETETKINEIIKEALEQIVDNFNSNEKLSEYTQNKITMNAELSNDTIVVKYTKEEEKTYTFIFNSPNLIINTEPNDEDFKNVFTVMNYAVQKRLENNTNIDNQITAFLNNEAEVDGLYKDATEANVVSYHIDISKKIGVQDNTTTQTPDNNATTAQENNENNNDNKNTETSPENTTEEGDE